VRLPRQPITFFIDFKPQFCYNTVINQMAGREGNNVSIDIKIDWLMAHGGLLVGVVSSGRLSALSGWCDSIIVVALPIGYIVAGDKYMAEA
jgi:hypothetical protein